jgi:hypothetical protein
MGTRLDEKNRGEGHIDQEKSLVDVFEHVIRGVRLNRLHERLHEKAERDNHARGGDGWTIIVEPNPA